MHKNCLKIILNNNEMAENKMAENKMAENVMIEEKQYLDLIENILANGYLEEGRNGKTKSIFGNMKYPAWILGWDCKPFCYFN
jgi:hypothetical protein